MMVSLNVINHKEGKRHTTIDIHNFVSMSNRQKWKDYGDFESKEVTIKTDTEELIINLYRHTNEL